MWFRTLKRFQQLLVEGCSQKTPPRARGLMWAAQRGPASLVPPAAGAEGQRAKGETWEPFAELSSSEGEQIPVDAINLSLSREELKFPGGRTSRGPPVVRGAVLLGRRMGHRCGSDGCAEQF